MEEVKTIIVTGAAGGMGSAATEELVSRGYAVIMACRDLQEASAVRSRILEKHPGAKIDIEEIHLDSFASVRMFAARIGQSGRPIYGLFNNAGVLPRHYSLSCNGYESTLAVNCLGPYLLTRLLLPALEKSAGVVVNMVSISAVAGKIRKDFFTRGEKAFSQLGTYSDTKLALICLTLAMAAKTSVRVNAADPGIVNTEMIRLDRWFDPLTDIIFRPFCNSPRKGAMPAVEALCSKEGTAMLYSGRSSRPISDKYKPAQETLDWLWAECERIVGFLD